MSAVDSGIRQLEVGVLGATGMVGQQFVRLLAGHPWFKTAWLGASERSEGRTYREAMKWRLSTPPPADVLGMNVDACTPGRAPKVLFSALDAWCRQGHRARLRRRRPHRRQQRPELPDVRRRAARDSRGQCRSSGPHRPAAARAWLVGRDRHQPELFDGGAVDRPRGAAQLRPVARDGHHAAGGVGRWLPRRGVARHSRQRDSGHLRRRREDGERDAEDPGHASSAMA